MDDNGIKNIEDWCKIKPYVKKIWYFNKNDNKKINEVYKDIKKYNSKDIKEYNSNVKTEKRLWAIFCGRKD